MGWLKPALAIVLGVTALRVALMAFNRTDLFVDEAQYWLWGQELALGYYSKPPLIGWVIRLSTELAGSDAPFWVRLPAPLFHAATSMILGAIAAHIYGRATAIWVAATFATLPMVAIGSFLISTDTIMFPFAALALLGWIRLCSGGSVRWALLAGAALGLGAMAKYAAIYLLLCAGLAAIALSAARPGWGKAAAAAVAFLVVISPNIGWNIANGLSTFEHTLDNADWIRDPGARAGWNFANLAEFFFSQFAVFGPVLFAALIWATFRGGAGDQSQRLFLLCSVPIVLIVCGQALLSQAYANWAASAYLSGTLAVVPMLVRYRWLIWPSIALHGAFALLIPIAAVFGTEWRYGAEDRLMLARYLGRAEMSAEIVTRARDAGVDTVVADDRDILADLFYGQREAGVALYARPVAGRPPNHYVQRYSLPAGTKGEVLLVTHPEGTPEGCAGIREIDTISPESGAYRDRTKLILVVPAQCLALH